ncbi:MAG: hypothetical protein JWN72_304 [Thermoleophilia bacterium]|nr:hypothetical protein [Thermoleophilia bacterium]
MNTNRTTAVDATPAIMYARIFGVVLTLVAILGFIVNSDQDTTESLLGFDVNLTHNFVHLATGVLGLLAGFTALISARIYAIVFGVVYTALGIWGLVHGDGFDPFGIFGEIDMADNFLHLAIGLVGIGAYVASKDDTRDRV